MEQSFGICGAAVARAITLPELGEVWGNHRVRILQPYINESFHDVSAIRKLFRTGRRISFREDCFQLKDGIGFKGPACVYLLVEVGSPD